MSRALVGAFLLMVVALGLASCSDGNENSESMNGADHSNMGGMNMGDPRATRANEVDGAALVQGPFAKLDTSPQGYDQVAGTAALARHDDDGTTVTVELTGLEPNAMYLAHVHDRPCADNGGGEHYKFDPAGSDYPPNEIHLAFMSSPEGTGFMTAENDKTVGPEAVSVVAHERELIDNKIACAQLS